MSRLKPKVTERPVQTQIIGRFITGKGVPQIWSVEILTIVSRKGNDEIETIYLSALKKHILIKKKKNPQQLESVF